MLNTIRTYSRRGNVKLLGVVLVLALGALGGTAIAGGSGKAPKASKAAKAMPRANRSPRTAAISQMASAYPVLGRAQQTADIPPTADQSQWVISQGGTPANTRLALVTPNGQSIYLVPANGELCVESAFMAGCGQYPSTTPQRLITVGTTLCSPALPSNEVEVVATMPPGAANVEMQYSNGTTTAITPTNGVIAVAAARSGPLPREISWIGANGPEKSWTGIPPNTASTSCG